MNIDIIKNKPEVIDFIATYARIEYALKASGDYLKKTSEARANWDKFAGDIHSQIENSSDMELLESRQFILSNPPQKQINDNGIVRWSKVSPNRGNTTKDLVVYINRIRNNLFHGGKFVGGYLEDFDKDLKFVRHALLIIKKIVPFIRKVEDAFKNG